MKSARPKVLHELAGRSMLAWVAKALAEAGVHRACAVLSDDLDAFEPFLAAHPGYAVAIQQNRQGTGDAVASAAYAYGKAERAPYAAGRLHRGTPIDSAAVLICAGDTPAIDGRTLADFVAKSDTSGAAVSVLGMRVPDPKGYGRCVTDASGTLLEIVEEKDVASDAVRRIDVVNSGVIYARTDPLFRLVAGLAPNNAQNEYYLTDIVSGARAAGLRAVVQTTDDYQSFAGINDRRQLADVEAFLVRRARLALMAGGVTMRLPETIYVEDGVTSGGDTTLEPGVHLAGNTRLGHRVHVGTHARLDGCDVGDGAIIGAGSILTGARIAPGERVPPASVRLD